jgi:hypothetical protein
MSQKPRCKKCGRVLSDPVSIARGMGPVYAGDTGRAGRRPQVRSRRSAGRTYDAVGGGAQQSPLPVQVAEQPKPERSKRERIRSIRSTRKAHFLAREPIQIGINTRTREPVIYSPVGVDGWEDEQGRQVSHEFLQSYLQRYQFI